MRASATYPTRPRRRNVSRHGLALKFGDPAEHSEHELAGCGARVDAHCHNAQRDALGLKTFHDAPQVGHGSREAVELGDDQRIAGPTEGEGVIKRLAGACRARLLALERQREGIAKAKAEGKYKGRKPTARAKAEEIRALSAGGVSLSEISRRLAIGKASVHRVLNA